MWCFVDFDFEMCFAPQRRALLHLSSGQMAPHPPLERAYLSTLRSPKSLEKHSVFAAFLPFHASASSIFFLLTPSFLSSSLFCSSLLPASAQPCFSSVHTVGSLRSKLLWMNVEICYLFNSYGCSKKTILITIGENLSI